MKVISPILIAGLWLCATVEIEGLWSPLESASSLAGLAKTHESPTIALMTSLNKALASDSTTQRMPGVGPGSMETDHTSLGNEQSRVLLRKVNLSAPVQIALPSMPSIASRSACS